MAHQPQNLVATPVSTTEITLSWDDVESLESESYDIERDGVVVDNYAGAHTVTSPYSDTGLQPDTEYTYRVRAVGGTTATPPPPMGDILIRASIFTPVVSITGSVSITPSTVVTASTVVTPTITATFDPAGITGLVAWYDFSDISSLWKDTARTSAVTADADVIKGVTDKSGSGNHLSEATNGPTYKVSIINGNSVARFDGSNDNLGVTTAGTYSQPFTFFISGNQITNNSQKPFTDGTGGGHRFSAVYNSNIGDTWASYYGTAIVNSSVSTNTSVHVWQTTANGASSRMRVDGGANTLAASTPGGDSITNIKLMNDGGVFTDFNLLEVLLYTGALSNGDIQSIGAYMAGRAGTSWTAVS